MFRRSVRTAENSAALASYEPLGRWLQPVGKRIASQRAGSSMWLYLDSLPEGSKCDYCTYMAPRAAVAC